MSVFLIGLAAVFSAVGLAYIKAPLWAWSGFVLVVLFVIPVFTTVSLWWVLPLWGVFVPLLGLLLIPHLRRQWIISPFRKWIKKRLPPISQTEREAISAGDVWLEGELFRGTLQWKDLFDLPKPTLTEAEKAFVDEKVEALCQLLNNWETQHITFDLPKPVWTFLKEERFFGMVLPKAYGGLEFSALAHSTIIQKIATHSMTAAITAMVPNSLGPGELILHYGTQEQKDYYLPRLAEGKEIPCFGLTSLEVGSDAGAITDKGVICHGRFEGKEVIGIRLSWNKRYITLAPIATVISLVVKLFDPEHLLGDQHELGITVCLVPTQLPGIDIGARHFPAHQAFFNGPIRGQDVFIPLSYVIGGQDRIGKGWHMLMESLSIGRSISLPALSSASMKMCYRSTGAYARIRKQFKVSIGRFEGVQSQLAQMAGYTYLSEATRLLGLVGLDIGCRPAVVGAIAKYHITEMGRQVVNNAMDIHGGRGIMLGPNNYLANAYENLPIGITVEGANILTRCLIIFGQGAIRCHPYIQEEIEAINLPDSKQGIKAFDKILGKHVSYTLSNMAKALVHAITLGKFAPAPKDEKLKHYAQQIQRMSLALACVSDVALILLGGALKRRENLSARLGDVMSYLYMSCAVMKYYREFSDREEDIDHCRWCLETNLYQVQEAFIDFFRNFPIPGVGNLLKVLIFPYGRSYKKPSDVLEQKLANAMLTPSAFRNRLAQNSFVGNRKNDPIAHLEYTLSQLLLCEPALKKVEKAIKQGSLSRSVDFQELIQQALIQKIVTEKEAELLKVYEEARLKAIQVDEFSHQELSRV